MSRTPALAIAPFIHSSHAITAATVGGELAAHPDVSERVAIAMPVRATLALIVFVIYERLPWETSK